MNDATDPRSGTHFKPKMGSERNFGLAFGAVFGVIAVLPLLHGKPIRIWLIVLSCAFLGIAFVAPYLLAPANRLWHRFGLLLGKIVTPIVMCLLWFVVVTPVGALMRLFGKDPLHLKRKSASKTYWIERSLTDSKVGSFKSQF